VQIPLGDFVQQRLCVGQQWQVPIRTPQERQQVLQQLARLS